MITNKKFVVSEDNKSWFVEETKPQGHPRKYPSGLRRNHIREQWKIASRKYYEAHREEILERNRKKWRQMFEK